MPYIGSEPSSGLFQELDALTASATDDYTLKLNGADYFPETVNNLLVSINGVIQGGSTMSLNGAVLTVGATLSSADTIDFVRVFGNVGTVSTPTDGSVTANKIGSGAVTTAKLADNSVTSAKITGVSFGKVLQAVASTPVASNLANTTQANWRSGGMTVQITPSATSSKILLLLMVCPNYESGANSSVTIFKNISSSVAVNTVISGGTNLGNATYGLANMISEGATTQPITLTILNAPSSTNQQTYTYAIRTNSGNNNSPLKGGSSAQFIALEVGV